ncbi:LysM peptidoglycan-binding domain-containing protein [Niameybacter massiliensis]|uniref:LysM peptidoglycan-binding domain-containing protein n=1 Tax=Holtiella tumoricola TaxID=3018743 RepID=A0AA42J0F3_9FIRM|nr:LysM peptidoglycan-binding domain-containing protein [Holtiella tumoricola]MDA3731330.1 LysM peptidoglycan-binding domain-containing protein [Holtiella tumoricola]
MSHFFKKIITAFFIIIPLLLSTICFASSLSPSSNTLYNGIDVSEWQGNIDFSQVKDSGIDIVYIRTGEGSNYIDAYFNTNYKNAKAAGLNIGFYHYVTATTPEEAIEQAKFFVSLTKDLDPNCKLAMDFESFGSLNNEQINTIASTFLQTVKELSGKDVIIYSDTYNAINTWDNSLTIYPLWVAEYDVTEPRANDKWNHWVGFQYSDAGTVPGINTNSVDLDHFTPDIFLSGGSNVTSSNTSSTNTSSGSSSNSLSYITYIVQSGDTLSAIALQYNTTVAELVALNNISNPNFIYVGESLTIPSSDTSPTSSTNTTSSTTTSSNTNTTSPTYIVQSGDTLSAIALQYNTTVAELVDLNNISNPNFIYVGETLILPQITSQTSTNIPTNTSSTYTVQVGDTLWGIAQQFDTTVATLTSLNNLSNPNLIYPGEIIQLP